ncbi:MAG: hypothetical protein EOO60_03890 [Hymenobacter sp.]|nr:MAG: hypothetical protein EOO60_03890 [Hymenobacter sp.]
MANITRHTAEIRIAPPTYSPPPLNGLFGTIPFYWALVDGKADRRVLESRRKQLVSPFLEYSFDEIKEAALAVFRGKTLRGTPDEATFLGEVELWRVHHQNQAQLAARA